MTKRDVRGDILASAERLAVERGFAGVTTKEVAAAAGCSEGSIYNHFHDRTDLLAHVVANRMIEANEHVAAAATREGTDLSELVRVMASAYVEIIGLSTSLVTDATVRQRFGTVLAGAGAPPDGMRAVLTDHIAAAQRERRVRDDVDADTLAFLITSCCHQAALHAYLGHGEDTRVQLDHLIASLSTLLARPKRR